MFNPWLGRAVLISSAAAIALFATSAAQATETASATISLTSTQGTGANITYSYDLSLTNTGTFGSTIGTFWFSWVPGQNYLASNPTIVSAPTAWEDGPDSNSVSVGGQEGASIEWQATSSAGYLDAGKTLSGFSFTTPDAPASVYGNSIYSFNGSHPSVLTAVVYAGAPFSDAGEHIQVQPVPEPTPALLLGVMGGAGLLFLRRRHIATAKIISAR